MKKYQNFFSENVHFLLVKFSVYLNRHAFVMKRNCSRALAPACGALVFFTSKESLNSESVCFGKKARLLPFLQDCAQYGGRAPPKI